MCKEAIIENIDVKKEEAKKAILAKFAMDEEIATLVANSYSEEEINNINSFNKDLLSFMTKRESKLMEAVLK